MSSIRIQGFVVTFEQVDIRMMLWFIVDSHLNFFDVPFLLVKPQPFETKLDDAL